MQWCSAAAVCAATGDSPPCSNTQCSSPTPPPVSIWTAFLYQECNTFNSASSLSPPLMGQLPHLCSPSYLGSPTFCMTCVTQSLFRRLCVMVVCRFTIGMAEQVFSQMDLWVCASSSSSLRGGVVFAMLWWSARPLCALLAWGWAIS